MISISAAILYLLTISSMYSLSVTVFLDGGGFLLNLVTTDGMASANKLGKVTGGFTVVVLVTSS